MTAFSWCHKHVRLIVLDGILRRIIIGRIELVTLIVERMGVILNLVCDNVTHGEQQLSGIIFGVLPIAQGKNFWKAIPLHEASLLSLEDVLAAKATLESKWVSHAGKKGFKMEGERL